MMFAAISRQGHRDKGNMATIDWGNRLATVYTWARALTFTNTRAHLVITFEHRRELPRHDRPAGRTPPGQFPLVRMAFFADPEGNLIELLHRPQAS